MNSKSAILAAIVLLSCIACISAETNGTTAPLDPAVRYGKLPNGLTFYVRANSYPKDRAEIRLVVRAGSILEEADQRGVAHFLEHMAFNGTKNFEKQELVNYLESIGMRYGADINAFTSFDETVYMLTIPTDQQDVLEKAITILQDWALNISFDTGEIEKEKPVILEEWRFRRGAPARIRDQQLPVLLKGSRYAERLPIGTRDSITGINRDTLLQFYRDWYRPDLMAIVAVGDFDPQRVQELIGQHFGALKNPEHPLVRKSFSVPERKESRFAIVSDPETTQSTVDVVYEFKLPLTDKIPDVRRSLMEQLFIGIMNRRLAFRTTGSDPPYARAFCNHQPYVNADQAWVLKAVTRNNEIEKGLAVLLEEAHRFHNYGIRDEELRLAKADFLRFLKNQFENREKTSSASHAALLVTHFLYGDPVPGIEWSYRFAEAQLPGIKSGDLNSTFRDVFNEDHYAILVAVPEKDDVKKPSESSLAAVIGSVRNMEISEFSADRLERMSSNIRRSEQLMDKLPVAGTVMQERNIPELNVTEWILSNGSRVFLKPTDFKNDEILVAAISPGGTSLTKESEDLPASLSADVAYESGLGTMDRPVIDRLISGKIAAVKPYISFYTEGLAGRTSFSDLETELQLLNLTFTAARFDQRAVAAYVANEKTLLQNRSLQPEVRFADEVNKILTQDHPRARPLTAEMFDELNPQRAVEIFRERFGNARDFTFVFVGSFDLAAIKPLILTYVASLPSQNATETWKDFKIQPPDGVVEKTFHFGKEQKAYVSLIFHGPYESSLNQRLRLMALRGYLEIKLRETLREDLGGVYSIGVAAAPKTAPYNSYDLNIRFSCAPERATELTDTVMKEIHNVKESASLPIVEKVKEALKRQHEVAIRTNTYWLAVLQAQVESEEDPHYVLGFPMAVDQLNPDSIRSAADQYLDTSQYIKAVLLPEQK